MSPARHPRRLARVLVTLLNLGAWSTLSAAGSDPGQFIATLPDQYGLDRLPGAWPGLYQMIRDIHAELGTPLVSNGLLYVGPLLEAIDRQAARERETGVTGELRNLASLGPDGGFLYSWVYQVPATRDLATADVHICHEAVGRPRGAGFITPAGAFVRTRLPESARSCAEVIAAGTPDETRSTTPGQ